MAAGSLTGRVRRASACTGQTSLCRPLGPFRRAGGCTVRSTSSRSIGFATHCSSSRRWTPV